MSGMAKRRQEPDSSSDSDEDEDVVASAPVGYRFFEVDDKWPPAARYERPSTAAVPKITAPGSVTQLQNVLPEELADEVYDFAVNTCAGQPWGGYLNAQELLSNDNISDPGMRLARACVRKLWLSSVPEKAPNLFAKDQSGEDLGDSHEAHSEAAAVRARILEQVHGVEVWVLTGSEGNRCDYHIDFAEFQRYQHNLIFFPLYSATIQVARASMTGGEFTAHKAGLEHYTKIGYKGAHVGGAHRVEEHITPEDGGWRKIPYTFNQSIIIDGTIPHLSTRVESINPVGLKRVIIATNLYDAVVGPRVRRFPIHSKQWQRVIKLNNILSKVSKSIAKNASSDQPELAKPSKAVGPYGEPLRDGPRGADPSSEEPRQTCSGGLRQDGAHRTAAECRRRSEVEGKVPVGHTGFSWLPAEGSDHRGKHQVPLSHTAFSWWGTSGAKSPLS